MKEFSQYSYLKILGRTCKCLETLNGLHSATRELWSTSELREPNHRSGIATIAKKVKLHHAQQKGEDIISREHQVSGEQTGHDEYCSIVLIQSKLEFSYSAFSNKYSNAILNI